MKIQTTPLKIQTTPFDYEYHGSTKRGNYTYGDYVLHEISVYNTITVDDVEMWAVYQTGVTYDYSDYNCPSPVLQMSCNGGANKGLEILDDLGDDPWDELDEDYINKILDYVNSYCSVIYTVDKLKELHEAVIKNRPELSDFLDPDIYTDDPDDYYEDEDTGQLIPKNEQ